MLKLEKASKISELKVEMLHEIGGAVGELWVSMLSFFGKELSNTADIEYASSPVSEKATRILYELYRSTKSPPVSELIRFLQKSLEKLYLE